MSWWSCWLKQVWSHFPKGEKWLWQFSNQQSVTNSGSGSIDKLLVSEAAGLTAIHHLHCCRNNSSLRPYYLHTSEQEVEEEANARWRMAERLDPYSLFSGPPRLQLLCKQVLLLSSSYSSSSTSILAYHSSSWGCWGLRRSWCGSCLFSTESHLNLILFGDMMNISSKIVIFHILKCLT